MNRLIIPFSAFLLFVSFWVSAQTTSNTVNPDWDNDGDWSGTAPGYDTNQSAILDDNSDISGNPLIINDGHTVTINAGVTLITDETITVKEGGTLIINGTVRGTDSGKEFKVEKGTLIINSGGLFDWDGFWTSDDEPSTITLDGDVIVDGDMSVKVDITGTGNINVGGTLNNDGGDIFGCTDAGDACCTGGGCLLPIELVSFTANLEDDRVVINWTTATEINNDFFTIYRSTASRSNWLSIGTLPGAGDSNESLDYSFTDDNYSNEFLYYQLKQTDFDGSYSYSDIVMVDATGIKKDLKLYPNPTVNVLNVEYHNIENTEFRLIDNVGNQLTVPKKLTSHTLQLDLTRLPAGHYFFCLGPDDCHQFIKTN